MKDKKIFINETNFREVYQDYDKQRFEGTGRWNFGSFEDFFFTTYFSFS